MTAGFDGAAGELNYFYNSSLGVTTLQGDTNGDKLPTLPSIFPAVLRWEIAT